MLNRLKKFLKFLLYYHLISFILLLIVRYLAEKGIKFTFKISENYKDLKYKNTNGLSIIESLLIQGNLFPIKQTESFNFNISLFIILILNAVLFFLILINFCIIDINRKQNIFNTLFFLIYQLINFCLIGFVSQLKKYSPLYDNTEDFFVFEDETLNSEFRNCLIFNKFTNLYVFFIQGVSIGILFIMFFIIYYGCCVSKYENQNNQENQKEKIN